MTSHSKQSDNHSNILDAQIQEQLEQQKALASVIKLIRQPLDLQTIFQTTATQVRQLLKADRVAVFKFDIESGWEGEFVSEDVASAWDSVITKKVYDHCFAEQFAVHYQEGRVQAVADIYAAGLSDCYAEILAQLQIRANLIVPLLQENVLWGLLCVHQCSDTRNWKESEIEFVRLIAEHFTVAIQQAEYFKKLELQAVKLVQGTQREKVITQIVNKIRRTLDIDTIFQTTTQQLRELIQAERVAIFRFNPDWSGDFVAESFAEGWTPLVNVQPTIIDTHLQETQGGRYVRNQTFTVNDIYQAGLDECHIALLEQFEAKSFATAPILQGDKLWGIIAAYQNSAPRIWVEDEVEIITQSGAQIGIALRQHELLFKARNQAKQQKTLTGVIARIRESLDLDTIFQTTVAEVQQMLKADRVAVFQFDAQQNCQGKFVWESVAPEWDSVVSAKVDYTFGDKFAVNYQQGRVQAVADIYAEGLSERHRQILAQFQVRANLVVPLLKGEDLWGLLCVHQCGNPRNWEQEEIEFTRQIADNLGVALQHNQTLLEARYQAEQQKALTGIITQIRESLDLETIFKTTITQVRQLLKTDRVGVFRFDTPTEWEGEFIYEDVAAGWNSAIANKVYDHCFSEKFAPLYQQGRVNAISDIHQEEFKHCYLKILEQFQVRANVVAPLLEEEKLWGLLCIHQCSNPRNWQSSEVEFISQIAEQLSIALKQDLYLKQVQTQAVQLAEATEREKAMERQKLLAATVDKIRQSLDIKTIFKTTTQAVRELLEVERVAIYRFNSDWRGKFVADSFKDDWKPVINTQPIVQPKFSDDDDDDDNLPRNETFVPISQGEKLWGLLVAYQNSQPRYWKDEEVNLLAQVGTQLGIAIQQAELLEKTKTQATKLAQALQELKQTQAQLIQGEKMAGLGQLIAGVAHEINNPVSFISGNLTYVTQYTEDLLKLVDIYHQNLDNLPVDIQKQIEELELDFIISDLPKTLDSMKIGAERIREIVLSLRNFSRKDEADLKAVNIHEGLDSTLLILGHRLKANGEYPGIEIIKKYSKLPSIECFPAQLNQVFMNILTNSIDALEQKFYKYEKSAKVTLNIEINTEVINDKVVMKIADNALGISEEVKNKIFDPFFTTKEVGKGTGLGLLICYQIVVEKHHGTIQCSSQVGEGTEFVIELPIKSGM